MIEFIKFERIVKNKIWRTCNGNFDQEIINYSPDSIVLTEDIEGQLFVVNDAESIF